MNATELEHIHAQISNLIAESGKLNAETDKFRREAKSYPIIALAAFAASVAAVGKICYGARDSRPGLSPRQGASDHRIGMLQSSMLHSGRCASHLFAGCGRRP